MNEYLDYIKVFLWVFSGLLVIVSIFYNYSFYRKTQKEIRSREANIKKEGAIENNSVKETEEQNQKYYPDKSPFLIIISIIFFILAFLANIKGENSVYQILALIFASIMIGVFFFQIAKGNKIEFWFQRSEKNLRLFYLMEIIEIIIGVIVLIAVYFWSKKILNF